MLVNLLLTVGILAGLGMIGTIVYHTVRNNLMRKAQTELDAKLEGAAMLQHAIDYLVPLGTGENLEWMNARIILEMAQHTLLYGDRCPLGTGCPYHQLWG